MNSEQYIENILQATSILTQQAIKNANFDKTIQAVIIQCTDPTIGKYKVQYQDGYWYAYSGSTQVSYSSGSSVYILVPNGDMSKDKTILGTTKKLGINYINVISQRQNYIPVGCNVITENVQYNLCSFQDEVITLYDISAVSENLITIDVDALKTYIASSSNLLLSMDVKTALPLKQRYNGNYGLRVYIDFKDNNTQSLITRRYDLDIDNMIGNPYELTNKTNQIRICDIDSQNFERINKIEIFVQDFPLQESGHSDDIFLSNFNITGAIALTSQERNGVSLNLIAKQGYIFTSSSLATDTRQIEAQVRVRTRAIDNSSQRLPFYWFIEDARITPNNMYYNQWGGRGWKCLNDYKIIQQAGAGNEAIIQFNPGNELFNVAKQDTFVRTTKYKCVVIYNDTVFSKQFEIINEDCDYSIQITSDEGTQFAYDIGHPNLQCVVKNEGQIQDPEYYDFIWGTVDNAGNFNSLPETTALNNDYNQALEDYEDFKDDLINENIYWQGSYNATITNEQHLEDLYAAVQAMERMQRVSANFVYSVDIGQIIKFKTFKCTIVVKATGIIVGTASITLVNSLSANNMYTLIINNGTQVFNYTENGVAPTNNSLDNPYEIPQLTFTVYDNKGKAVEQEFNYDEIEWIVPVQNTMLNIDGNYDGELNEDETKMIYKNYKVFNYNILNQYFANKTQNNIQLKVSYNGLTLVAYTNLNFIKQGNSGTNGTDFQVRIVPNIADGYDQLTDYPIVTIPYGGEPTTNWTHVDGTHNGRWFKVQLWHNGNKIFSGNQATGSTRTQEDKPIRVTWSILKNKYTHSNSDVSCLTINQDTGSIVYNDSNLLNVPANIVKATVVYDGLTYYANMPIITVKQLNSGAASYYAKLKKNTGFRQAVYKSSGTKPSYDNHNPFEIVLTKNLSNGTYEDISVNTVLDPPTYTWSYVGEYYNKATNQLVSLSHLMSAIGAAQPAINQKWVKPTDNYDGQVINNAIIVNIAVAGSDRILMHIPVHLMLNRYEQSALNGWDGNSVQLGGTNGGMILSPQIGAGIKQMDNSFTGMVMGKVKDSSSIDLDTEVGLFGYDHGERTIFLDADTGKAQFGKNDSGKIIIDPRNSQAVIQSGNYSPGSGTTPGQGMQINLTTPSINFGSGNFSVDQYGHVTLKGATLTGNSTTIENLDSLLANSQTIADLQEQIQGTTQVWSGTGVPTLSNYPANQWTTTQDKRNHVGNLYFQSDGDCYRFLQTSANIFEWVLIPDSSAQALQTANDALQRVTEIYDADTASGLLITDYYTKNQTDTQLTAVEGRINSTMSSNYTSKAQFRSSRYDNLLPYPYYEITHVDNGITWTDNGDGTITANGTATEDSQFYFTKTFAGYEFFTNEDIYTISTGVTGCSSSTYFMMGYAGNTESDGQYFTSLTINGTNAYSNQYTIDTAGYSRFGRFYLKIKSGVTVTDLKFKPMLEKGSIAHDYISYADSMGGVKAEVTTTDNKISSLQQTVEGFQTTVSQTYATKAQVNQNADIINLLPAVYHVENEFGNPYTASGLTWTLNKNGSVTVEGTATANGTYNFPGYSLSTNVSPVLLDPEKQYRVHGCPASGSTSTYRIVARCWTSLQTPDGTGGTTYSDIGSGVTVPTGYRYMQVYAVVYSGYTCPSGGLTFYPMVQIGEVDHMYVSSHNVGSLATRMKTAQSSITQNANNIALKVSTTDYTGATIATLINQSADTVTIKAPHIELSGTDIAGRINDSQVSIDAARINLNGAVTANNYFKINRDGSIQSTSGTIGGWTIASNALYNGTNSMTSTTVGTYIGTGGIRQYKSSSAYVNIKDGVITAIGASISGSITATSLTLGSGVTVAASKVSGLASVATSGAYSDLSGKPTIPSLTGYIYQNGTVGSTPASGATGFVVSTAGLLQASNAIIWGKIYASSGTIGGWNISSDSLSYTKTFSGIQYGITLRPYSSAAANGAVYVTKVQNGTTTYPVRINYDGSFYASSATISGDVTATSGKIAGWSISGDWFIKSTLTGSGTNQVEYSPFLLSSPGTNAGNVAFGVRKRTYNGSTYGSPTYPFYVTHSGYLRAESAYISGTIVSSNATITGGKIDIQSTSSQTDMIRLQYSASSTYVSNTNTQAYQQIYRKALDTNIYSYSRMDPSGFDLHSDWHQYYSAASYHHAWFRQLSTTTQADYGKFQLQANCIRWWDYCSQGSDARFKTNINNLQKRDVFQLIDNLRCVSYQIINQPENVHHGFVAQEVEKLNYDHRWKLVLTGDDDYKSIAYTELIPDLVAAVQELKKEILALKNAN